MARYTKEFKTEAVGQVLERGYTIVTKVTRTQTKAIERVEEIARNQQSDTKIHGRDGKIRGGNSYGNAPCPPGDKK